MKQIGHVHEQETKMRIEKENLHSKITEFCVLAKTDLTEREAAANLLADTEKANVALHSVFKHAHEAIQDQKQVFDDIFTSCTSPKKLVVGKFGTTVTVCCASSVTTITLIFPKINNIINLKLMSLKMVQLTSLLLAHWKQRRL